jgi:hypothetical protein
MKSHYSRAGSIYPTPNYSRVEERPKKNSLLKSVEVKEGQGPKVKGRKVIKIALG